MGFVGNYAPCGLAPQIDGMPVILKKDSSIRKSLYACDRIRTHDLLVRSQTLYPAELRTLAEQRKLYQNDRSVSSIKFFPYIN